MSKKIFIIDDDTSVLDIMEQVFIYEGFEVLTSPVADNYHNLIRQNNVDLIIIDYLLRGVNGGEICRQIKLSPEFGHLPVIIYSAYSGPFMSLESYGCDAFIPKPFDLTDFLEQVSKLLHYSPMGILAD